MHCLQCGQTISTYCMEPTTKKIQLRFMRKCSGQQRGSLPLSADETCTNTALFQLPGPMFMSVLSLLVAALLLLLAVLPWGHQ